MQSKNVLWLGLLFILLLITFCISKYIDRFHPDIQTIATPKTEIIDNDLELKPLNVAEISSTYNEKEDEVDENYLHVIALVEQEEKDIEDAYNKALEEERVKNLQKQKKTTLKPQVKKVIKKSIPIKEPTYKEGKKVVIEKVLASQKVVTFGNLTKFEKDRLELLIQNIKQNPSYDVEIKTYKNSHKLSKIISFIKSLGISKDKIRVTQKQTNYIVSAEPNYIELLITKKD